MAGVDQALEDRIAERLGAGDLGGAATAAIQGYGPQILGYLTSVVRDEVVAADAFSTFSEDLWVGLPGFRRASSFRTWAYKLAWHAAMRTLRDPAKKRQRPLASSLASELAEKVRSSTAVHLRTETKTAVQELRDELSPDEQTLLILRIDRDLPWREVAEVMGEEEPTIRKRFERVKEKLRTLAQARGLLGS
jgi:RNA polymerase sigma-70 factor (ECF subfamily)